MVEVKREREVVMKIQLRGEEQGKSTASGADISGNGSGGGRSCGGDGGRGCGGVGGNSGCGYLKICRV